MRSNTYIQRELLRKDKRKFSGDAISREKARFCLSLVLCLGDAKWLNPRPNHGEKRVFW